MLRIFGFFTALLLISAPQPSAAATMTFDSMGNALISSYSENGIDVTTGNPFFNLNEFGGSNVHMDDGGTTAPFEITFTMATAFDAISFLLDPLGFDYTVTDQSTGNTTGSTFANVALQGYREGALVAQSIFNMGATNQTYSFGSGFRNLTSLVMGFASPPGGPLAGGSLIGQCTGSPCSHYVVDNVALAPVPLPATLGLMSVALGVFVWVGRRRRRIA